MRFISAVTRMASYALIAACAAWSVPVHAQSVSVGDSATSAARSASGYYAISADIRRCSSPTCGGWFLRELNQATTICHDGQAAEQCYTPVLDWSDPNMTESQQAELLDAARTSTQSGNVYAIVRGTFARTSSTTPQPQLGRFVITEAWLAGGDGAAAGTFVHVQDNGLRCFVAPCPNLAETVLNTSQTTSIADVDFAPSGMIDTEVADYTQAMYGPYGILVAGDRYTVQVDDRTAPGRTATQAYQRLGATP